MHLLITMLLNLNMILDLKLTLFFIRTFLVGIRFSLDEPAADDRDNACDGKSNDSCFPHISGHILAEIINIRIVCNHIPIITITVTITVSISISIN